METSGGEKASKWLGKKKISTAMSGLQMHLEKFSKKESRNEGNWDWEKVEQKKKTQKHEM